MNIPLPRRLRGHSPEWYRAWFGPSGDDRPDEPDHPRTWRCYFLGCDVPEPDFVTMRRYTDGSTQGQTFAIDCRRCGRTIRPWDNDYPNVDPERSWRGD